MDLHLSQLQHLRVVGSRCGQQRTEAESGAESLFGCPSQVLQVSAHQLGGTKRRSLCDGEFVPE